MRFHLGDRVRIIGTKCTGVIVGTRQITNNETGETSITYYISWHDPYGPERRDIPFRARQLELCDPPFQVGGRVRVKYPKRCGWEYGVLLPDPNEQGWRVLPDGWPKASWVRIPEDWLSTKNCLLTNFELSCIM